MPRFFIDRPIFAWVLAILITLAGTAAIFRLPVSAYPPIAPPQVSITATYPGASAEVVEKTVTSVIEQQLTGVDNLIYFDSTSRSNGTMQITLTFLNGTDPDIAQVQVQNRLSVAQPRLPQEVVNNGIVVAKANNDFLMVIALKSEDPGFCPVLAVPPSSAPAMPCAFGSTRTSCAVSTSVPPMP
jgi:multidrug efflux pump